MRAPRFWQRGGALPALLAPLGSLYAATTARRMRRPGWRAPVPVLCCGAATAGGAGKTPLALDLAARLGAGGRRVAFLTRGYRGAARDVLRVDPATHDATAVGDEPLLLAAVAPTYVGADRVASARAAVADGAQVLVMDDGLQNPGLHKDVSLLAIDGGFGFGNGRVIPAGPLREPVEAAAARCRTAVLIGDDSAAALAALPHGLPVLRAELLPQPDPALRDARVVAFAGIARPDKFFASARDVGMRPVACHGFPDHHVFAPAELERLAAQAAAAGAILLTTAKDAVRLPPAWRARAEVLPVRIEWQAPEAIEAILAALLG